MVAQTYGRIRALTNKIRDETGVKKRRESCHELRELLANPQNREQLLQEASGKKALQAVWTTIMQVTLMAADKAISKKTKSGPHKDDINIPYYMLLRLDEFTKVANTDSLLNSQLVREVLHYCLSLLTNDAAMKQAGMDLFHMLDHLCSRPCYVTYFRTGTEMETILAELQVQFRQPNRNPYFELAAKALDSLLRTCKSLGVGMHLLISPCLKMIGSWCRNRLQVMDTVRASGIVGVEYVCAAAAALLSSHPEHSIYELSKQASDIMSLAKQCYPSASSKKSKEAIIDYFLAHLLVCQKAGEVQGLLPGDLGDVGDASLNGDDIDKLLALICTSSDIDKARMGTTASTVVVVSNHSNREPSMEPTDLSRNHFELCARLLACAQRLYLSEAEWSVMEHPVEALTQAIPADPHPCNVEMEDIITKPFQSCSMTDLVKSPWMARVGIPLWSYCDHVLSREASQLEPASQGTPTSASSNGIRPQNDVQHFVPILRIMSDEMYDAESNKLPINFLQLVCACAETFPLGQCWSSNTQRNWHSFTPDDLLKEDKAYCNGCSPDDLALVVSLVTNILEAFGGPNGNAQTQRWALTCLIRLSESSALVALAAQRRQKGSGDSSCRALHLVWQRVWNTLFRTNLRYASYTQHVSSDSLGELVLVLLTEIVKQQCTDPIIDATAVGTQRSIGEFIHANQSSVWNLEAFSNALTVQVPAVFDLVSAMLRYAGLSEEDGGDMIDVSGPSSSMRPDSSFLNNVPTRSRRFRLVSFCLRFLEGTVASGAASEERSALVEVASSCLLQLYSGKATSCLSTFDKTGSVGFSDYDSLRKFFCVTNTPVDRRDLRTHDSPPATFSLFFQSLWNDKVNTFPRAWLPDSDVPSIEFDSSELTIARELLGRVRQQRGDCRCDFVSPTVSSALYSYVSECFLKLSAPPSNDVDDGYEYDENAMRDDDDDGSTVTVPTMLRRLSTLKLLLTVAFSSDDDKAFNQRDMDSVESRVRELLDTIVRHFPSSDQNDENCVKVATSLYQILQALSVISLSVDRVSIPETISSKLDRLFTMIVSLVREYGQSRMYVQPVATPATQSERKRTTIDFSDDEDDNDEMDQDSGFGSEEEDELAHSGNKRRRKASSWDNGSTKRRRSKDSSASESVHNVPSFECVKVLSSILILLRPSYGVCRMVADSIALAREDEDGGSRGYGGSCDANVDACLHCLDLCCSPMVIHRTQSLDADSAEDDMLDPEMEGAATNGTIIALCYDLVMHVRAAVGQESDRYLVGFEVSADLVHQREKKGFGKLEKRDRRNIVDILLPHDRKVLKRRPNLRRRQIASATSVFRDAQEKLHKIFDPKFQADIIGPSLLDLSGPVRKQAGNAVGAALRSFTSQENVVKSIKKNLAPLLPKENVTLSGQFQEWWARDSKPDDVDSVWKDAFYSVQSFAVEVNGVIAGSTTQVDLFRESLFAIVLLAAERPDLEALCYRACEKTAGLIGFGTVQQLISSECEYICDRWLDTGKPLLKLPLLLTAPTLLFHVLQAGSAKFLSASLGLELSKATSDELRKDMRYVSLKQVRELVAREYFHRSASFLVPIICMKNAIQPNENVSSAEYLEEVTEALCEASGLENTRRVLRLHFSDILAFVEPFLHCIDDATNELGERVFTYVKDLLPDDDFNKLRKKNARMAVQALLHHWGKAGKGFEDFHLSKESVLGAITVLAQEHERQHGMEPFAIVGSSVTECVLHGRFWLSQSILVRQMERRWSSIELVFSLVLEYIKSDKKLNANSQLGYCLHTILDILADPRLSPIYPSALEMLNAFLASVSGKVEDAASEIRPIFYRLVGTLVKTHERCQDDLIGECLSSWQREKGFVHRSSGLLRAANASRETGDVWGWDADNSVSKAERVESALAEENAKINGDLLKILKGTYDALDILFRMTELPEPPPDPLPEKFAIPLESLSTFVLNAEAYSSLHRKDPKLCARSLAHSFIQKDDSSARTLQESVSAFLGTSASLLTSHLGLQSQNLRNVAHEVAQPPEPSSECCTSINLTLLLDELSFVQRKMEEVASNPVEVKGREGVNQSDWYSLINVLLKLCESSFCEDIRAAASRCVGALGPSDVENLAMVELELSGNGSELYQTAQDRRSDLLHGIMGSCLGSLSQYMLSPSPQTAVSALEAAKAILTETETYSLVEKADHRRLLNPLEPINVSKKAKQSDFVAPNGYLDTMLARITAGDVALSTDGDKSWCWHEALWTWDHNGRISYEDWVKFITCAMITCCYVEDEKENGPESVRGSGFFRYCIQLCSLEHEFAAKVFPGVVLDLLLNGTSSDAKANMSESLACQYLSKCFTVLLESPSCEDGGQSAPEALALAVDTIDMIRLVMQKKFEESKPKKKRSLTPNRGSKGLAMVRPGIILRLNGLTVARACMKVNRFASALFYVDMHSEMCYGSASGVLQRLANGELSRTADQIDISGFNAGRGGSTSNDNEEAPSHTGSDSEHLSLSSILFQSFGALRDADEAGAVKLESSAMRFMDDSFKWNSGDSLQFDALERLRALDMQCQDENGRILASQRVLDCMEDIGLEGVLQTYTAGLVSNQSEASGTILSTVEQSNLRDQWFRGRLKSMQWDGEIFSSAFAQEPPQNYVGVRGSITARVGFHEGLSKALSSFMKDDTAAFKGLLSQARGCLIDDLSSNRQGEARLDGMVDTVEKLQFLNDIEYLSDGKSCKDLASTWQSQTETALGMNVVESPVTTIEDPLRLGESVTWARELVLRVFQSKDTGYREDLRDSLVSHLWQIGSVARLASRTDLADSAVQRLHTVLHTPGLDEIALLRVRFEEALVMESRGDFAAAIRNVKLLSSHLEGVKYRDGRLSSRPESLYADALLSCGEWMDRYKVEPGKMIMENYLCPAKELADEIRTRDAKRSLDSLTSEARSRLNNHRSFAAHLALAKLTSALFEDACKVVEGQEWQMLLSNIAEKQNEIDKCKSMVSAPTQTKKRKSSSGKKARPPSVEIKYKDLNGFIPARTKELENMKAERSKTEDSIPLYLILALKSYCNALIHAGNSDSSGISTHVYRLISLWFGNSDDDSGRAAAVNKAMGTLVGEIPSFRFVPLAYQIFSQLANGREDFQAILRCLVLRMCAQHPYHCLVQLMALANGDVVGAVAGANEVRSNVDSAKVDCAKEIVNQLSNDESPLVRELVKTYELFVKAYSDLALADSKEIRKEYKDGKNIPMSAVNDSKNNISKHFGKRGIGDRVYKPCIITKPPSIDPRAEYGDGITPPAGSEFVRRFDTQFDISLEGRSLPKFVMCCGSKGNEYKQVVKGNDDVRSDAVMQQVFCFVNDLMKRRNGSSDQSNGRDSFNTGGSRAIKDQLKIVTYHIVPLGPATGVIEFVKDSISFNDCVVSGTHRRYYPNEKGFNPREEMNSVESSPIEAKRETFESICRRHSPSFRHFFTERFGYSLPLWYAARTKYTRSCAVNSIVGYMLGIGDRHIKNILLQNKTGELVHIDFGIVFEQGKLFKVPETVPFRLTRDIVDGMGPCGTEGTFSRTAEETTLLLRKNKDALLTILSAVVADPLYHFKLTPKEARNRQRTENEEADDDQAEHSEVTGDEKNEAALRAIARIQEKLTGTQQSVQGEVQLLINEARDVDNLCSIFAGWSPWV